MMANPILRKLFKEFGDMVRRVARDDRIRVLVVRSANDAWRGEKEGVRKIEDVWMLMERDDLGLARSFGKNIFEKWH